MEYLGRCYGVEAIEYQGRASRGLLVAAGTGLMLSLMDQCHALRWCLDVDGLTAEQLARFGDWLVCAHNVTEFVAVAGWYSATDPTPLAAAVARLNRRADVFCYVQCHGARDPFALLRTARDLTELQIQLRARQYDLAYEGDDHA